MDFIATYWWLWLVGMMVCYGFVIYSQTQRMKRISKADPKDWQSGEFSKGVGVMMLAGLAGAGFLLMLLLSIVVNIIIYIKG